MPADVLRLFVFARHAESVANAANMLNSNPSQPVVLTARGRTQARALGAQLANLHVDLAVGTRLLRTRQTIDIALDGREVPTLIEPGFDEIRAGDLEGAPIEAYRSWQEQHTPGDRLPHGESIEDALRRYTDALRRLLGRTETVTLVVIHDLALRYIAAAAATSPSPSNGTAFPNAVPYLFDQPTARRAATSLAAFGHGGERSNDPGGGAAAKGIGDDTLSVPFAGDDGRL
jgi:broad specificity phosphatase PhoE